MSAESKRAAQARYRAKHKAKIAAKSKANYAANIDERRTKAKARRETNPAEGRTASLAWYRRNKAKAYAKHRAWRLANPEKAKRRYVEIREFIVALKSEPCMDCGGTFDPVCMDFDHRPSEIKIANVAAMCSGLKPTALIKAEILKCDLVCSNCHRLRTFKTRKR